MAEYRAGLAELSPAYRALMGRKFLAMALVEAEARLAIAATAILPN